MTIEEKSDVVASDDAATEEKVVSKDVFADFNFDDLELSMEAMLKAGVHFGHQKSRRNPKIDPYVYSVRGGVTILDLAQTKEYMERALAFLAEIKKSGKEIVIVGTKKQARHLVISLAKNTGMPYVVDRWLGGTFTNFTQMRKRARYLLKLQEEIDKGELKKYTKFEQAKKREESDKLERKIGGIKNMADLPGAIFVVDLKEDHLAVKEAQRKGIPVVAIADANTNPADADYPIPGNDDALSSLTYILAHVCKVLK